jgi:single-stranded DNA-specific DHH superfamily exonuclease
MLSKEELVRIKEILDRSQRPMYFFDDDPDGLSSFLIFYRYIRTGQGIPIKSSPSLGREYAQKVHSYGPDLIIVLDKPQVCEEFFDLVDSNIPILWLDHHEPQNGKIKKDNIYYFNSRKTKEGYGEPTSYMCYNVVKDEQYDDLWIAMTGFVGDWFLPEKNFINEFERQYPDMLSSKVTEPQQALYENRIGELVRVFSFLQKGTMAEVKKNVKILTRIESPYEILDGKSSAGRLLFKFYSERKKEYDALMSNALKSADDSKVFVFRYKDSSNSFTSDMSNELLYRFPEKIIIIAREKSGDMRMSLRSSKLKIPEVLSKALAGFDGYGGGHENACGCNIKEKDFEQFLEKFKSLL